MALALCRRGNHRRGRRVCAVKIKETKTKNAKDKTYENINQDTGNALSLDQ
jgi:hypothetical protein